MNDINPSRLVLARRRRGFTKRRLSDETGVSLRSLVAYEAGLQQPTTSSLLRLSKLLSFPTEFFFGPDIDEPSLHGASFRALSKLTARQRDQALGSASLALSLADWLEARFSLPVPDVPQLPSVDPETAADAVRKSWRLGERPIGNVIHLLEAHGVRVFSLVEECAEVDAFSFWRGTTPYVFLNTMKSAERSRMDAAHELGHLTLHWKHAAPRGRDVEREAELFGSALLMPRGSILADAPRGGRLDQLIKSKRRWGVSVASLAYRMHLVGLLSDWQYRSLFIEMGEAGYRRSEPNGIHREASQVLAKVFASLRAEGVSKTDVARELDLPPEELDKIIFGLVLTRVESPNTKARPKKSPDRADLRLV